MISSIHKTAMPLLRHTVPAICRMVSSGVGPLGRPDSWERMRVMLRSWVG